MAKFVILDCAHGGRVLYTCEAKTVKAAVESAVSGSISLQNAFLAGESLYAANLGGVDLEGANLDGANLHNANLHNAKLSDSTRLPNGQTFKEFLNLVVLLHDAGLLPKSIQQGGIKERNETT